tara:strand:+ start:4393 stop:9138 length:4746 start_codon:yes stop_codon:yes gene_type:complete
MAVPNNFYRDIQGKNIQIFPVVRISNATGVDIRLSTNSVSYPIGSPDSPSVHWMPTLVSLPAIRESVDLENRNYRISNLTLNISNVPYDGKRFTELFNNSLTNAEVRIWWISPSVTHVLAYDQGGEYFDDSAMQVFYGKVRRYTHDDEKVQVIVEDQSQSIFDKQVPNKSTGGEVNVPEKFRNKPLPIVYGVVDKSPVMPYFQEVEGDTLKYKLLASYPATDDNITIDGIKQFRTNDLDQLGVTVRQSTLYFYDNNTYFNVSQTFENIDDGAENFTPKAADGVIELEGDILEEGDDSNSVGNDTTAGRLRVVQIRDYEKATAIPWQDGVGDNYIEFESADGAIGRIDGMIHVKEAGEYTSYGTFGFFKLKLQDMELPNNISEGEEPTTKVYIRGNNFSYSSAGNSPDDENVNPPWSSGTDENFRTNWGVSVNTSLSVNHVNNQDVNTTRQSFGFYQTKYITSTGLTEFDFIDDNENEIFKTLQQYTHINVGIPLHYNSTNEDAYSGETDLFVHFTLYDFKMKHSFLVDGINDKEFYANVFGRSINASDKRCRWAYYIISDLLKSELGYEKSIPYIATDNETLYPIDSDPGTDHLDFTLDKKISSKKLIEDISSVSSLIPHFDNMGNFKLDYIKPVYTLDDGLIVQASDVISHSYSRTKIEDVYTKVIVKYKYDYARDNLMLESKHTAIRKWDADNELNVGGFHNFELYGGSGSILQDYVYDYYSFPNTSNADSTLVIEDDRSKYIRDTNTANNYAKWLLFWHCNQHLIMKIRLPLKYLYLEVGNIIGFDKQIGDVKPYGIKYDRNIDYQDTTVIGHMINGQQAFPHFMVTSLSKTLKYVEVEVIQMHNLSNNIITAGAIGGAVNLDAYGREPININSEATYSDGSEIYATPTGDEGICGILDTEEYVYNNDNYDPLADPNTAITNDGLYDETLWNQLGIVGGKTTPQAYEGSMTHFAFDTLSSAQTYYNNFHEQLEEQQGFPTNTVWYIMPAQGCELSGYEPPPPEITTGHVKMHPTPQDTPLDETWITMDIDDIWQYFDSITSELYSIQNFFLHTKIEYIEDPMLPLTEMQIKVEFSIDGQIYSEVIITEVASIDNLIGTAIFDLGAVLTLAWFLQDHLASPVPYVEVFAKPVYNSSRDTDEGTEAGWVQLGKVLIPYDWVDPWAEYESLDPPNGYYRLAEDFDGYNVGITAYKIYFSQSNLDHHSRSSYLTNDEFNDFTTGNNNPFVKFEHYGDDEEYDRVELANKISAIESLPVLPDDYFGARTSFIELLDDNGDMDFFIPDADGIYFKQNVHTILYFPAGLRLVAFHSLGKMDEVSIGYTYSNNVGKYILTFNIKDVIESYTTSSGETKSGSYHSEILRQFNHVCEYNIPVSLYINMEMLALDIAAKPDGAKFTNAAGFSREYSQAYYFLNNVVQYWEGNTSKPRTHGLAYSIGENKVTTSVEKMQITFGIEIVEDTQILGGSILNMFRYLFGDPAEGQEFSFNVMDEDTGQETDIFSKYIDIIAQEIAGEDPTTGEESTLIRYDVNQDGAVNIYDVVTLTNHIFSNDPYNVNYDLNNDGVVDVLDAILVINLILEE